MKFNANYPVKVKLTPLGERIILGHDRKIVEGGYTEIPLWKLIGIFGGHIHHGMEPFDVNIIIDDEFLEEEVTMENNKVVVDVEVNTKELDETIEKVNELVKLVEKVKSLINDLTDNQKISKEKQLGIKPEDLPGHKFSHEFFER